MNSESFKISHLKISDFNQFEDFELNLTYPKGHNLYGQPLNKVCLIGQSGVGKTSILNIIKSQILKEEIKFSSKKCLIEILWQKNFEYRRSKYENNKYKIYKAVGNAFFEDIIKLADTWYEMSDSDFRLLQNIENQQLINLPANIIYQGQNTKKELSFDEPFIDFAETSPLQTWKFVKENVLNYIRAEKSARDSINKDTDSVEEIVKKAELLKKWKDENPSPIERLANNCLNPYLKKFNLQVKTKLNYSNDSDISQIKIQTLQGEDLGSFEEKLSTGTKQILYTALPLFVLDKKNATVLFDEPERSLYPDVQKSVVDFYTSLSKNSQYFFATHSPIIASSFEPWEIVELEFDENGKVRQKLWYEGERHVDNYFTDPRYLSWDDIFMKLFGLKQDGTELRIKMLRELASLKDSIEKIKDEEKRKAKYIEYKRIAKLVNYNFGK